MLGQFLSTVELEKRNPRCFHPTAGLSTETLSLNTLAAGDPTQLRSGINRLLPAFFGWISGAAFPLAGRIRR
jgi:hypothetical protein